MKKFKNLTKIIAIGLMITSMSIGTIACGKPTTDKTETQDAVDYPYEILDESVELSDDIKSWEKDEIGQDGVYTKTDGDYTYIIISGGTFDKPGYGIGLIDIKVKDEVNIKYDIVEPQETTQPTTESNDVETVTVGKDGKMDVVQVPDDKKKDMEGTVPQGTKTPYMMLRVKGKDIKVNSEKTKAEDFFKEQTENSEQTENEESNK